jgi:hypothetical protein
LRVPVLAENGLISRDWVRYFTALSDGISGAISGESLTVTGAITGASLVVSGNVTAADVHATRFFRTDYAAAQGEWTPVAFNAANFTASGAMTWTLTAGDQTTFAYTLEGKTMTVALVLGTTTVGGVVSAQLRVAIPGGFTAAKTMDSAFKYLDNGTEGTGLCRVNAAGTTLVLFKTLAAPNWTLATDATAISMQMSFEVQ